MLFTNFVKIVSVFGWVMRMDYKDVLGHVGTCRGALRYWE